ncbi:MAG: FAD-binding protein [Deltaproteobacteria bacterium]|nr:MAG: FAD-binding protein [Deltaproteobacteria bacterium]
MRLQVSNLLLHLHELERAPELLRRRAARVLSLELDEIRTIRVTRRSVDARGRRPPRFVVAVEVEVSRVPTYLPPGVRRLALPRPALRRAPPRFTHPPIIVGAGPAGLFCARTLAEAGVRAVIVERGRAVEPRKRDVARLYRTGHLDPESNVSFGEGGAGTFTDGKLSTRVRDREVREVLEILVAHGADPEILVSGRPHLGSERLPGIIAHLRRWLLAQGCEIHFETRVTGLLVEGGRIAGVRLAGGGRLSSRHVVLAPGNAARELYRELARIPGLLQPKPLAMGLRVEHPQALIDRIQYGASAGHPALPPAEYKLAGRGGGRGVWAFCMCPGGVVVPTPTVSEALCVNGMSGARRSSRWANSALVVEVGPEDFARAGFGDDLLAGVHFQEAVERKAYALGGGAYRAPAQRLTDFLAGRVGTLPRRSSYPRGLSAADLRGLYPRVLVRALAEAIEGFGRRLRGFCSEEAVLVGAETRTSAPVSFPRGEHLQSPALPGLYPCGEGCGHAGGIVSAAIDGMRVARTLLRATGN